MTASWEDTLDAVGARIEVWRKVIGGGTPPGDLELPATRLPPHLLARAKALLSEYGHLEKAMVARGDELRSAIGARQASRPARSPLYLDRHV